MRIANFEKRLFGWVIDEFIPCFAGAVLIFLSMKYQFLTTSWFIRTLFGILAAYFIYIFFNTLVLFFSNGFTLGAAIFGIRIIHTNSKALTFKECLLKSIATGIIPFVIVNAIYMLATHTERSAFDRLTDTLVAENRHPND